MAAGKLDLIIEQRATFRRVFRWRESDGTTPVDLTGYIAKMQAWDDDHRTKLIDFNTQGAVTIDAAEGSITVELTPAVTLTLTFDIARYDLLLTAPNTERVFEKGRRVCVTAWPA